MSGIIDQLQNLLQHSGSPLTRQRNMSDIIDQLHSISHITREVL